TTATSDPLNRHSTSSRQAGDPNWTVNFHHASERDGQTQLTIVREFDEAPWKWRIVAVDTNGVEHTESGCTGTSARKTATWTYTFRVPLAQVKEFRAQIRPLYWVEFRNVALRGKGLEKRNQSSRHPEAQVAARNPQTGAQSGKLGRCTVELLAV